MAERTISVEELIGERVKGLQEYAPEPLEAIAARLGMPVGQLIKLDANENPYGPTQQTTAALAGFAYYHRYPDPIARDLRAAIGRYVGVDADQVLVGNGSDELIDLILRVFRPGPNGGGIAQVINCPPTFGMYQFYGTTNDMQVIEIPRDAEFGVDVAAIERLCEEDPQPKVLFVCSPNNPDGGLLSDEYLDRLLALPVLVILDEAYADFSGGSRAGMVAERDNLIVLRTFSKWAGLAGLRVGYGIFPRALIPALLRLKSPYNVNAAAYVAALTTLKSVDAALANVAKIIDERERFVASLRELPFLQVYDTQSNYVLCRVKDVSIVALRAAMERRGIILRYYSQPGLDDCTRITVGTPMQDEAVLIVLRSFIL